MKNSTACVSVLLNFRRCEHVSASTRRVHGEYEGLAAQFVPSHLRLRDESLRLLTAIEVAPLPASARVVLSQRHNPVHTFRAALLSRFNSYGHDPANS